MDFTQDEQEELDKLLNDISNLDTDLDAMDVHSITKASATARKDVFQMKQELVEPKKMRILEPEIDREREQKDLHARRHILPDERLVKEAPKAEEKNKGRVKNVYKDEEKIAYPLPFEVISTEPNMVVASTLFFDFENEKNEMDLRQGNMMFPPVSKK